MLIFRYTKAQVTYNINLFVTKISQTTSSFTSSSFCHPILTSEEHTNGCRLGIDSWADTCCAGKHCYVQEFVEGKMVTASGFTSSLGKLQHLPIANVVYAYDHPGGYTLLLECNNSIYLGDKMDDSLMNPIQGEENDVWIDTRPRLYYPDSQDAQSVIFPDLTRLPILYDGVLPYLPVHRPLKEELHTCKRLELTSRDDWDPFLMNGSFSSLSGTPTDSDMSYIQHHLDDTDPIGAHLMSIQLPALLIQSPLLHDVTPDDSDDSTFSSISKVNTKRNDSLTAEELSKRLHIGLATAKRTLLATLHQCLRTTGLLTRRFKTDESQLRYKQLTRGYGTFYTDFLKVSTKSLHGHIGGVLYTNKLGFKKFYPCETEQGLETSRTLRNFIETVGLPQAMHSDNHSNFKEGLFKKLLKKFGIYSTYTEPHSPWQNRAEPAIGEVKTYARRLMQWSRKPIHLWCFCYEYAADVLSLLATGRFELQGRIPYEAIMNYTPDISEYASFTWYQWCHYFDKQTKCKKLCRWLGPAHHIGQSFCSYILLENGTFIA
jgi:hypothetical protein